MFVNFNILNFNNVCVIFAANSQEAPGRPSEDQDTSQIDPSWVTLSGYWVLNFITLGFITAINCFGSLTSSVFIGSDNILQFSLVF